MFNTLMFVSISTIVHKNSPLFEVGGKHGGILKLTSWPGLDASEWWKTMGNSYDYEHIVYNVMYTGQSYISALLASGTLEQTVWSLERVWW